MVALENGQAILKRADARARVQECSLVVPALNV